MKIGKFGWRRVVATSVLGLVASGCALEPTGGSPGEQVGRESAPITGWLWQSVTAYGRYQESDSVEVSIGTLNFLTGVFGNLQGPANGFTYVQASVVEDSTWPGHYHGALAASVGSGASILGGTSTPIYPGYAWQPATSCNSTWPGHPLDSHPLAQPPGATRWGCYLTEASNTDGTSFSDSWDRVFISYDGSSANAGRGNATLNCSGNAEATARCFPIVSLDVDAAQGGSSSGPTSRVIAANANGRTCALSGIGGIFRDNGSGPADGSRLIFDGNTWTLSTSVNKFATADCFH